MIAPYHNSQGAIVRKHVPIKFRYWKKRKGQEDWCVTDKIKQKCWEQMVKLFEFDLYPIDTEIMMKQALRCMGKNGGISSMSCTKNMC